MATYCTFSEFNGGVRATLEEFRKQLVVFNRAALIYACSVMNSLTGDWQGHTDAKAHAELVRSLFPPNIANVIAPAYEDRQRPRGMFHRQQLLFVAKEAVTVCPESGGKDTIALTYGGGLGVLLLMANDLLTKGLTGPEYLFPGERKAKAAG